MPALHGKKMTIHVEQTGISPYAIFMILSFILGYVYVIFRMKKDHVPKQIILYAVMLTFCCCVYFAVMYTVLFSGGMGFSSIGGVLGILIGMFIMGWIDKANREAVFRTFIQAIPLMYAVSKLGCFFVGCCHGIPYDGWMSLTYVGTADHLPDCSVFPIQLLESIVFAGIFILACNLPKKYSNLIVMCTCCVAKFGLDYLRMSHVDQWISVNQIFCLMILAGTILYSWISSDIPRCSIRPGSVRHYH